MTAAPVVADLVRLLDALRIAPRARAALRAAAECGDAAEVLRALDDARRVLAGPSVANVAAVGEVRWTRSRVLREARRTRRRAGVES